LKPFLNKSASRGVGGKKRLVRVTGEIAECIKGVRNRCAYVAKSNAFIEKQRDGRFIRGVENGRRGPAPLSSRDA